MFPLPNLEGKGLTVLAQGDRGVDLDLRGDRLILYKLPHWNFNQKAS
jgi:hypothetical protein